MLTRRFTRRESVLLVVLVLVMLAGSYVLAVHMPIRKQLAELEVERQDAELEVDLCTIRLAQYEKMKTELDEIFALAEDKITVMPAYDNVKPLMEKMNVIFWGLEPNVSFGPVTIEEGVAIRPVQFSFNAPSYAEARNTLARFTATGWRCLLDDLTISAGESKAVTSGPVSVSGSITFYENAT